MNNNIHMLKSVMALLIAVTLFACEGNYQNVKKLNLSDGEPIAVGKNVNFKYTENTDYNNTDTARSEEHTSELQSRPHLVCRLLLEKKKKKKKKIQKATKRNYKHNTKIHKI